MYKNSEIDWWTHGRAHILEIISSWDSKQSLCHMGKELWNMTKCILQLFFYLSLHILIKSFDFYLDGCLICIQIR